MTAVPLGAEIGGPWPIRCDRVVEPDQANALHQSYLAAFAHLPTEAAARHVLNAGEFHQEMADPRILKYSAWRSATQPLALATVTNELEAVPWISPDFFTARYPEHAARQAVYYLGVAHVTPGHGQYRLLERMLRELVARLAADRGVLAYDVCAFNERSVQFARRVEAALRRASSVEVRVVDTQTYYAAEFG